MISSIFENVKEGVITNEPSFILNNIISLIVVILIFIITKRVKKVMGGKGQYVVLKYPFKRGVSSELSLFIALNCLVFGVVWLISYQFEAIALLLFLFCLRYVYKIKSNNKRYQNLNDLNGVLLVQTKRKLGMPKSVVLYQTDGKYRLLKRNTKRLFWENVDKNTYYEVKKTSTIDYQISIIFMDKKIKKYDFQLRTL